MMQNFNDADLPQTLVDRLSAIGFTTPTPIQQKAIPEALKGADILGSAQTGTGKTGAFGIPLTSFLMQNDSSNALILLPTRELAMQVEKAIQMFMGRNKLSTALLIGGDSMPKQLTQLRKSPRLIIGTPGRINDHLERKTLTFKNTHFLVLDEMDRMLDMGFDVQLEAIAKFLPEKRQTLMFTATMPKKMEKLAARYLNNPIRISVGGNQTPALNIKQESVRLRDDEKYARFVKEIEERTGSIITFVKTKHGADRMAVKLRTAGHTVEALHGDLRQSKRTRVIDQFRREKCRILIATDVAARGLDIPHIEHVINYDLPQCPEDYIHRIGRTARAGATGCALSFLSPADSGKWHAIQKLIDPEYKGGPSSNKGDSKRSSGRPGKRPTNKSGNFKGKSPTAKTANTKSRKPFAKKIASR